MVVWPDGSELGVEGVCEGTIATEERGERGFGFDPLFIPVDGDGRTFSQMTDAEKNALSHRGRAFAALVAALRPRGVKPNVTTKPRWSLPVVRKSRSSVGEMPSPNSAWSRRTNVGGRMPSSAGQLTLQPSSSASCTSVQPRPSRSRNDGCQRAPLKSPTITVGASPSSARSPMARSWSPHRAASCVGGDGCTPTTRAGWPCTSSVTSIVGRPSSWITPPASMGRRLHTAMPAGVPSGCSAR